MEGGRNQDASAKLLKQKYNLQNAPEVSAAARHTERTTGKRISQNPIDRIQNYLGRFHEIIDQDPNDPQGVQKREHALGLIKAQFHRKYVIKPEEIPESYWQLQRRIMRERGQGGDVNEAFWEEQKRQNTEAIIADQRASLDRWIDYLSSPDAPYSDEMKYLTLRSILSMGEYDKGKKVFTKRTKGTVKPFPDLDREALAYVLDVLDKHAKEQPIDVTSIDSKNLDRFKNAVSSVDFPYLYAWGIEKVTPAKKEDLQNTEGVWVKYDQISKIENGTDNKGNKIYTTDENGKKIVRQLSSSIQGHGTGWCTAGESTAESQLQGGDFYLYYSNDSDGNPTQPRVAIRMEGDSIAEVRGIAEDQNLDPYVSTIVEEKLKEFPDGKAYKKKVADMKQLTDIDRKMQAGTPLQPDELKFLYEIRNPIQGFGYEKDPRIKELLDKRNHQEDMPIVFNCEPSQIARNIDELGPGKKAYVGPIVPGIFGRLQELGIEHVYTSFPEGRIRIQQIEIGGKTPEMLHEELKQNGVDITPHAEDVLKSSSFTTLSTTERIDVVNLRASDLGISGDHTTAEIYKKALELGLSLCPAELGPHSILQSQNLNGFVGMKQIKDTNGTPDVFGFDQKGERPVLYGTDARDRKKWDEETLFIFRLSPPEQNADAQEKADTHRLQNVRSLLKKIIKP